MNILALDLATRTGWALGPARWFDHGEVKFGTVLLKGVGDEAERAWGNLSCWLRDMLTTNDIDVIAVEAPLARVMDGGTNAATVILLNGLYANIVGCAACYGIRVRKVASTTARKSFMGVGRPDNPKLAVKIHARLCGWMVRDDNEADALAVHWWACGHELGAKRLV